MPIKSTLHARLARNASHPPRAGQPTAEGGHTELGLLLVEDAVAALLSADHVMDR